ncbi:response regulator [Psychrosphaera aquimarina]|uniref:Response regulator n=1 Tax=Psychrosphaera aquimarina TaxID=2044854 RepID=A0ABU3QWB4_9GAMM|nr:response regulator [Psychrosphaera aquimarina]MDU0111726.1 response regulator [Psychrosphaera aquimarina]
MRSNIIFSGKKILIVDDQKPFQVMIRGMLKDLDVSKISVAQSGEAAIVKCGQNQYDILLIDYNLGAGRNGRQLFEEIKERKLIPDSSICIIVTGESQATAVVGALEVLPDDYIVKPFSQNLLLQRVTKSWLKKQVFVPFYHSMNANDYETSLELINKIIAKYPRYKASCNKYKAQVLFYLGRYQELNDYIDSFLEKKRLNWALIYKSKILKHEKKYLASIKFAKEAVLQSKMNVEAYDVITDCYLAKGEIEQAYNWVRSGIERSPFSVPRQYKLSAVAKLNKDFESSIKACSQVVDLTSNSFKKDYRHLLNHIRNIIDIVDLEEDEKKKRKYNQDALYALQQSKRDSSSFTDIDQEDFEQLCLARLDSVNGLNLKAKKSFSELTQKFNDPDFKIPSGLLADSISLMLKIGEFETALDYVKQIKQSKIELDDFTRSMIMDAQYMAKDHMTSMRLLNKTGIEAFSRGDLKEANDLFEKSLVIAPMNTGSALNLVQVLIALMKQNPKQKWTYIERCKNVFRIIDGMPIGEGHKKRATDLKEQFEQFLAKK